MCTTVVKMTSYLLFFAYKRGGGPKIMIFMHTYYLNGLLVEFMYNLIFLTMTICNKIMVSINTNNIEEKKNCGQKQMTIICQRSSFF